MPSPRRVHDPSDRVHELLDRIDGSWREALSWIDAGDPIQALREIQGASTQLCCLTDWASESTVGDDFLTDLGSRIEDLQRLHAELLRRCQEALSETGRRLGQVRRDRRALGSYSSGNPKEAGFSRIF